MSAPVKPFSTSQKILALKGLYGMTNRVIAECLGISTQAVHKHLTKAREETWAIYQDWLRERKDPSVR